MLTGNQKTDDVAGQPPVSSTANNQVGETTQEEKEASQRGTKRKLDPDTPEPCKEPAPGKFTIPQVYRLTPGGTSLLPSWHPAMSSVLFI